MLFFADLWWAIVCSLVGTGHAGGGGLYPRAASASSRPAPPNHRRSAVAELWFALFGEGAHAFLLIGGGETRMEQAPLEAQALGQPGLKGLIDGLLGHEHGGAGEAGDLLRQLERLAQKLGRRQHPRHQARTLRLGRIHHAAAQHQVHGLRLAERTRQALGPAGAGKRAEGDLGLAELGILGGQHDIAHHGDLASPAERIACHRRDGGLAALGEALPILGDEVGEIDVGEIPVLHLLYVGAGGKRLLAAGADIKEMKDRDFADVYLTDFITKDWERLAQCRKPTIAAVAGYALGGGCEIAMMCDIVLAADDAKFGQPEITLGTIPGAGGTQRLARALGKAKTMDLVLTGRMMDAAEAERSGLVARVLPAAELLAEALKLAEKIAGFSRPSVLMAKEAVNQAFETGLAEGLRFERRLFHASFATADQKEGMGAFAEKRKPQFRNR